MSDLNPTLHSLYIHPLKSCGGLRVDSALVIETGLDLDRLWMVADPDGKFLTQRELPRLALVQPTLQHSDLVLRAPGMLALHLALDRVEGAARARVWDDEMSAYDMGALAAQWFSDFLGRPARLLRFDPEQRRLSSRQWCGDIEAENAFSDGFPLLVTSTASLAELNQRLAAAGHAPVGMERFRPNLVLDGLQAHEEDHIDTIEFNCAEGPVLLKLVKPCPRCSIPGVDPARGEFSPLVGQTLAQYRADARLDGALSFGMNAVILRGTDCQLRAGMPAAGTLRFD